MPPIAKFKKEEIVECALKIVEEKGADALTARALGEVLGSSPRPIFTIFESMEEVFNETLALAENIYQSYIQKGLQENPPFKGTGKAYIRFAKEHPKLFQLLFMAENHTPPDITHIFNRLDKEYKKILQAITSVNNVSVKVADKLYRHMWIYTHGIAVLIATKVCKFSEEEISFMLTEVFSSLLVNLNKKGE